MLELLIVVVRGLTLALRGHRDVTVPVFAFRGLPSIARLGACGKNTGHVKQAHGFCGLLAEIAMCLANQVSLTMTFVRGIGDSA